MNNLQLLHRALHNQSNPIGESLRGAWAGDREVQIREIPEASSFDNCDRQSRKEKVRHVSIINRDMPYLLLVDFERALPFTGWTVADADFLARILIERSKDSIALSTIKFDVFELWEHSTPAGNNT